MNCVTVHTLRAHWRWQKAECIAANWQFESESDLLCMDASENNISPSKKEETTTTTKTKTNTQQNDININQAARIVW